MVHNGHLPVSKGVPERGYLILRIHEFPQSDILADRGDRMEILYGVTSKGKPISALAINTLTLK